MYQQTSWHETPRIVHSACARKFADEAICSESPHTPTGSPLISSASLSTHPLRSAGVVSEIRIERLFTIEENRHSFLDCHPILRHTKTARFHPSKSATQTHETRSLSGQVRLPCAAGGGGRFPAARRSAGHTPPKPAPAPPGP